MLVFWMVILLILRHTTISIHSIHFQSTPFSNLEASILKSSSHFSSIYSVSRSNKSESQPLALEKKQVKTKTNPLKSYHLRLFLVEGHRYRDKPSKTLQETSMTHFFQLSRRKLWPNFSLGTNPPTKNPCKNQLGHGSDRSK